MRAVTLLLLALIALGLCALLLALAASAANLIGLEDLALFTKSFAPLIALGLFAGASLLIYAGVTRRIATDSLFWTWIDGIWVVASVMAFVLTVWASSSEAWKVLAQDQLRILKEGEQLLPPRVDRFLWNHCRPEMMRPDRTPEDIRGEAAICGFAEATRTLGGKMATVRSRGEGERPEPGTRLRVIPGVTTPVTAAWNDIEDLIHYYDRVDDAYETNLARYRSLARNDAMRLLWVFVFPVAAAFRLNRSIADLLRRRAAKA